MFSYIDGERLNTLLWSIDQVRDSWTVVQYGFEPEQAQR